MALCLPAGARFWWTGRTIISTDHARCPMLVEGDDVTMVPTTESTSPAITVPSITGGCIVIQRPYCRVTLDNALPVLPSMKFILEHHAAVHVKEMPTDVVMSFDLGDGAYLDGNNCFLRRLGVYADGDSKCMRVSAQHALLFLHGTSTTVLPFVTHTLTYEIDGDALLLAAVASTAVIDGTTGPNILVMRLRHLDRQKIHIVRPCPLRRLTITGPTFVRLRKDRAEVSGRLVTVDGDMVVAGGTQDSWPISTLYTAFCVKDGATLVIDEDVDIGHCVFFEAFNNSIIEVAPRHFMAADAIATDGSTIELPCACETVGIHATRESRVWGVAAHTVTASITAHSRCVAHAATHATVFVDADSDMLLVLDESTYVDRGDSDTGLHLFHL